MSQIWHSKSIDPPLAVTREIHCVQGGQPVHRFPVEQDDTGAWVVRTDRMESVIFRGYGTETADWLEALRNCSPDSPRLLTKHGLFQAERALAALRESVSKLELALGQAKGLPTEPWDDGVNRRLSRHD